MAAIEPGKIRNVAVVGHRGTGKTSLVEALLFQTGEVNRLGTIEAGTTVSDSDEDEQRRAALDLALARAHEWQGRKINLVDCPGDPSFQGEARCALRGRRGGARRRLGRDGIRVRRRPASGELRRGARPGPRARRQHARPRARRLLRGASAKSGSDSTSKCVAVHIPIGFEHELEGIVDVLHMCAYMTRTGGERSGRDSRTG